MEILLSLGIGLGLSAACGFRVFVPMLAMSLAARSGHLVLGDHFAWIESTPALIAFGAATLLEICGYYIPWIDNLLDTVATPSAIVAGIIATGAMVDDMSPLMEWSVAIIGGGGVSGVVQVGTGLTRSASSITTGGLGNPVVSTLEFGGSVVMSLLAILIPFLALIAVFVLMFLAFKVVRRFRRRKKQAVGT